MDAIEYDMAKDTLSFIGGVRKLEHKRDTGGHGKLTVSPDGGLNIGRRMLVVVRPQSQGQLEPRAPSQSSTRSSSKGHTTGGGLLDKANAVQVIDHGANQKEAVRRLFDAHVMIASLEEQLTEKELEINRLSKELEKVGLDSEKSQVTEKADPRAHGDKMEHFEQSKSSPEQPSPKKVDKQRIALEKVQNQEAKQAGEDRRGFPKWLQADQHSRQIIERMWSTISQEYFDQNILEKSTMINNLWSCGYDFVMRWGGSPNEQLENQVKSLTEKNIRVTKEAQMENSMLRQHIRKIEVQYKKMQDNSHRLQLAYDEMRLSWSVAHSPSNDQMGDMSRTTSMAAMGDGEATMTPGAARRMSQSISTTGETSASMTPAMRRTSQGNRSSGTGSTFLQTPTGAAALPRAASSQQAISLHSQSQAALAAGPAGRSVSAATLAPSPVGRTSSMLAPSPIGRSQSAAPLLSPAARSQSQVSPVVTPATRSSRAVPPPLASPTMSEPAVSLEEAQAAATRLGVPINVAMARLVGNKTLAEDDTLMVNALADDIDTMDHEIFEPIKLLDQDQQEQIIDMVNEKVRRILMLDPTRWTDGRLPFGLRPDNTPPDIIKLEAENRYFKAKLQEAHEEIENLKAELEAARNQLTVDPLEQKKGGALLFSRVANQFAVLSKGARGPREHGDGDQASGGAAAFNEMSDKLAELERLLREQQEKLKQAEAQKNQLQRLLQQKELELKENTAELGKLRGAAKRSKDVPDSSRSFWVQADKSRPEKVGLQVSKDGTVLVVQNVEPGGQIDDWNKRNPERQVRRGSRIEEINDVGGDADLLLKAFEEEQLLRMKFTNPDEFLGRSSRGGVHSREALKKSQNMLHQVLKQVATDKNLDASPNQKEVEDLLSIGASQGSQFGDFGSTTCPSTADMVMSYHNTDSTTSSKETPNVRAVPHFENWIDELMPSGGMSEGQQKELDELRQRCADQQEEIARLVMIIDELRARLEKLTGEAPPELSNLMSGLLQKVGLKEVVDAGLTTYNLRPVFQRLYQDALQRIQRFAIIKESVRAANNAFGKLAEKANVGDLSSASLPDVQRLNATAAATLSGMWYHSDYIFKRMCDYAMTQGVETLVLKADKMSLEEFIGPQLGPQLESDTNLERLPGRRSMRPRGGLAGNKLSHLTAGEQQSGLRQHQLRKAQLTDPNPTPFTAYVAALKEARGDLQPEEWVRASLKRTGEKRPLKIDDHGLAKTLKVAAGLNPSGGGAVLPGSRSLPVLPKIKKVSPDNEAEPTASKKTPEPQ